ncbi:mechanosensitive ion channel, partial [Salmonella enterica subsp. enterica serovar Kentucky]|nr:mechanosensitive ion channel [Salmonella enterica subsp. enterica serovar Kentucky]
QANVARANLDYASAQMTPTISLEPSVQHYLNDKYPSHEVLDKNNLAAGVLLVMFRPFRAGEYVDLGGVAGTVLNVQIFSTTMRAV